LVPTPEADLLQHVVELLKSGPILLAVTRVDYIQAESQEVFQRFSQLLYFRVIFLLRVLGANRNYLEAFVDCIGDDLAAVLA